MCSVFNRFFISPQQIEIHKNPNKIISSFHTPATRAPTRARRNDCTPARTETLIHRGHLLPPDLNVMGLCASVPARDVSSDKTSHQPAPSNSLTRVTVSISTPEVSYRRQFRNIWKMVWSLNSALSRKRPATRNFKREENSSDSICSIEALKNLKWGRKIKYFLATFFHHGRNVNESDRFIFFPAKAFFLRDDPRGESAPCLSFVP